MWNKISLSVRMTIAFWAVCVIILLIPAGHQCPLGDKCLMQNQQQFNGCGECRPGTDCWKLDSVHYAQPQLDYDQCDSVLNLKQCLK